MQDSVVITIYDISRDITPVLSKPTANAIMIKVPVRFEHRAWLEIPLSWREGERRKHEAQRPGSWVFLYSVRGAMVFRSRISE